MSTDTYCPDCGADLNCLNCGSCPDCDGDNCVCNWSDEDDDE